MLSAALARPGPPSDALSRALTLRPPTQSGRGVGAARRVYGHGCGHGFTSSPTPQSRAVQPPAEPRQQQTTELGPFLGLHFDNVLGDALCAKRRLARRLSHVS